MSRDLTVRRLSPEDAELAVKAIRDLKLETPSELARDLSVEYLRRFLARNDHHLTVALLDGKPVGFVLAYELCRVDRDQNMMFFYEVTVDPGYRKRGIAKSLVFFLKDLCRNRNILKMWVQTNVSNLAAMRLYAATGGKQSLAGDEVHFSYGPDFT